PVVKRIAHRIRNGLRPLAEFFLRGCITGAIALRHPVNSHRPPLVVVTFKPYFSKVPEASVRCNIFWGKVIVVIKNSHWRSKLLIKDLRIFCLEQKRRIQKSLRCSYHILLLSINVRCIPSSSPRSSARPRSLPMAEYPGLVFFFRSSSIW